MAGEFTIHPKPTRLDSVPPNAKAYDGCLLRVLETYRPNNTEAIDRLNSVLVETHESSAGDALVMACGNCAHTLVSIGGIVYGGPSCPALPRNAG